VRWAFVGTPPSAGCICAASISRGTCSIAALSQSMRSARPQHTTIIAGQPQIKMGMPPRPAADRVRPLPLASIFDCPAACVSDPDPLDLDRRAVRFQRLRHHRCKAGDHKSCQHVARELVGKYKQLGGDATRTAGE
jgi:hypothetical protein